MELCYDAALKKFGVGTAIIAATWIAAWVVPGGGIAYAAVLVVAKTTTIAALNGGATGAVMSAAVALVQGKRWEELVYAAINGAADSAGNLFVLHNDGIGLWQHETDVVEMLAPSFSDFIDMLHE